MPFNDKEGLHEILRARSNFTTTDVAVWVTDEGHVERKVMVHLEDWEVVMQEMIDQVERDNKTKAQKVSALYPIRALSPWSGTAKCFEVVTDQLKSLSRLGTVLHVTGRDGQRYRKKFFPVPLYLVSDMQEDWFLMGVGACLARPRGYASRPWNGWLDQTYSTIPKPLSTA